MKCLNCYSLGNELSQGIKVDAFESVTTLDPETEIILTATIQSVPLLSDPVFAIKRSFAAASQTCLTFINEAPKDTKPSTDGVLLAVDSEEWIPKSDMEQISIVDPCGLKGHVLLFVRKSCQHALLSTKDPTHTISVDSKGVPKPTRTTRANLLLEALFANNAAPIQVTSDQAN